MSKLNRNDSSDDVKESSDNKDCDSGFIPSSANLEIESDNKDERSANQKKSTPTSRNIGKEAVGETEDVDSGFCGVSAELSSKVADLKIDNKEPEPSPPLQPWELFYQQTEDGGDTQLHFACIDGLEKFVAALIRLTPHSCLFNIQNNDFQTAMHLATLSSKPRIVRMLLIAGADPLIRDRNGNNALHLSSEAGDLQCVKALTTPISLSEIQEAHRLYGHRSQDKSTSYLRKPPQLPFNLEFRNYEGERCVHLAAINGHVDVLRQLVQIGADINAKEGKSGRTPLHIAIEAANDEVLTFLLEECKPVLNIEAITYGGLTAYQFASLLKNVNFQNNLMKRGAEPLTPPDTDDDSDMEDEDAPVHITNFI